MSAINYLYNKLYFSSWKKPKSLGKNVKVELDLSSYATKPIWKMQQVLLNPILLKRLI